MKHELIQSAQAADVVRLGIPPERVPAILGRPFEPSQLVADAEARRAIAQANGVADAIFRVNSQESELDQ